jgi:hypothetical protein
MYRDYEGKLSCREAFRDAGVGEPTLFISQNNMFRLFNSGRKEKWHIIRDGVDALIIPEFVFVTGFSRKDE